MKTRHQKIVLPLSRQKFYASFSRGTVQAQKNGWPSGAAGFSSNIYAKKKIKNIYIFTSKTLAIIINKGIVILKPKRKNFKTIKKPKKAKEQHKMRRWLMILIKAVVKASMHTDASIGEYMFKVMQGWR